MRRATIYKVVENESHTAFPYKELADVTRQVQKLSEYGFATCILNVPDEIDCEF
jgi:hypothetical protein